MLLEDVFRMIDQLTPQQKQQVRQYLDAEQESLRAEIDALLASAQPTPLHAGTMDVDKLLQAAETMWAGLDENDIQAIIQAMNEEYIEPVDEDGFPLL